jgi:Arylsulfatase A and related enzymes
MGWNELREQIFANQKRLGVIPAKTTLTPWPDGQPEYGGAKLAKWDTLSADEKKLFARQAEVFAAYVAYTDHEIGRVIQAVDDMGKLDNTLVIYISGDNGTSAEGYDRRHALRLGCAPRHRRSGCGSVEILRRLGLPADHSPHGSGLGRGPLIRRSSG